MLETYRVRPRGSVHLWEYINPRVGPSYFKSPCGQVRDRRQLTSSYPPAAKRCTMCFPKEF